MFFFVLDFQFLCVEQNSIPYMSEVIFFYISVKARIVDSYIKNITLGSGECISSFDVTHTVHPLFQQN